MHQETHFGTIGSVASLHRRLFAVDQLLHGLQQRIAAGGAAKHRRGYKQMRWVDHNALRFALDKYDPIAVAAEPGGAERRRWTRRLRQLRRGSRSEERIVVGMIAAAAAVAAIAARGLGGRTGRRRRRIGRTVLASRRGFGVIDILPRVGARRS